MSRCRKILAGPDRKGGEGEGGGGSTNKRPEVNRLVVYGLPDIRATKGN